MIGNVVGNYKITEKIGEGGMGAVFKGIDLMLEREVAIKVLRPELAGQPEIVERFRAEAVTLAKLNHPKIATLYNFFRHRDDFLMVMEFVPGQTLGDVIGERGALRCEQAIPMFCQALEGIGHAHSLGIIHRDVKPGNMMLTASGMVKVMDFGIARVLGTAGMTKAGHLIGTIEYMSPEQVKGRHTDARSDIYSSGIVLYELLTGRVPFASDSEYDLMRSQIEEPPPPPRNFSASIPHSVEQVILRALAKKPEDRFETANDFREALLNASLNRSLIADSQVRSARPVQRSDVFQTGEDIPKETRVAGSREFPGQPSESHIKGTRLATGVDSFEQGMPDAHAFTDERSRAAGIGDVYQTTGGSSGILSKLNWKHYAGAGLMLSLLVFASIALIVRGLSSDEKVIDAPRTNQTPVASQPSLPVAPKSDADAGAASQSSGRSAPPPTDASGAGIEMPKPVETNPRDDDAESTSKKNTARKASQTGTSQRTRREDTSQRARRDDGGQRTTKTDDSASRRAKAMRALDQ